LDLSSPHSAHHQLELSQFFFKEEVLGSMILEMGLKKSGGIDFSAAALADRGPQRFVFKANIYKYIGNWSVHLLLPASICSFLGSNCYAKGRKISERC
jgi:hypothetical protein